MARFERNLEGEIASLGIDWTVGNEGKEGIGITSRFPPLYGDRALEEGELGEGRLNLVLPILIFEVLTY